MTARIQHSLGAMRRLIQMTATRVTIYVEGRDLDPEFYSRICGTICVDHGLSYEIVVADRIASTGGGGKGVLLSLFQYLRKRGTLIDRTGPISKVVMFYVDKDTDDVFRTKRRSAHLVYTSGYCAENHLFCNGDLLSSIATAGSVDLGIVRNRIADPALWRKNAATRWRGWIALCLTAHKYRLGGRSSYSVDHDTIASRVNVPNLAVCQTDLQVRSGATANDFIQVMNWAKSKVDAAIRLGEHDLIFKGKWYAVFVMYELDQINLTNGPINRNGAKDRLIGSLMATLSFNDAWAEHYKEPLRRAISAM
jgi:hypothetical protein